MAKRLDLDACKTKVRKAQSPEKIQQVKMVYLDSKQSLFCSKICKREYLSSEVARVARARVAAYENISFSSLFAAGDVLGGGISMTQRQKFNTDDAVQCLHNKSSSLGVPNTNLSNFTCLLVDFGKVLCSFANELQQNSNASSRETIFHKY